jgi:hypothetical protein
LVFGWFLGADKIRKSLNKVSKVKLNILFDIGLKFISPAILLVLIGLGSKFITSLELKITLLIVSVSIFLVVSKKILNWKKKLKLPFVE